MTEGRTGGIVLAGGGSRRMGQDKALLRYQGRTLLEHVVAALLPVVGRVVVVADVADKYPLACAPVIVDLYPDTGPVGGILTGLIELGEGSHLVVACDMPRLQRDVLNLLLTAATPEWDAVAPEIEGRAEPLCAVYRHTAAPKLQAFLETGRRAAQQAVTLLNTKWIYEQALRRVDPALATFTNINTPEELADFERGTAPGR